MKFSTLIALSEFDAMFDNGMWRRPFVARRHFLPYGHSHGGSSGKSDGGGGVDTGDHDGDEQYVSDRQDSLRNGGVGGGGVDTGDHDGDEQYGRGREPEDPGSWRDGSGWRGGGGGVDTVDHDGDEQYGRGREPEDPSGWRGGSGVIPEDSGAASGGNIIIPEASASGNGSGGDGWNPPETPTPVSTSVASSETDVIIGDPVEAMQPSGVVLKNGEVVGAFGIGVTDSDDSIVNDTSFAAPGDHRDKDPGTHTLEDGGLLVVTVDSNGNRIETLYPADYRYKEGYDTGRSILTITRPDGSTVTQHLAGGEFVSERKYNSLTPQVRVYEDIIQAGIAKADSGASNWAERADRYRELQIHFAADERTADFLLLDQESGEPVLVADWLNNQIEVYEGRHQEHQSRQATREAISAEVSMAIQNALASDSLTSVTLSDGTTVSRDSDGNVSVRDDETSVSYRPDGSTSRILVWDADDAGYKEVRNDRDRILEQGAYLKGHVMPQVLDDGTTISRQDMSGDGWADTIKVTRPNDSVEHHRDTDGDGSPDQVTVQDDNGLAAYTLEEWAEEQTRRREYQGVDEGAVTAENADAAWAMHQAAVDKAVTVLREGGTADELTAAAAEIGRIASQWQGSGVTADDGRLMADGLLDLSRTLSENAATSREYANQQAAFEQFQEDMQQVEDGKARIQTVLSKWEAHPRGADPMLQVPGELLYGEEVGDYSGPPSEISAVEWLRETVAKDSAWRERNQSSPEYNRMLIEQEVGASDPVLGTPVGLDEMAAAQARNDYQNWQSRMLIEQEVGASDPVLGTPVGLDEMAAAQARNDYQDWQSRMLIEQEVGASDPVLGTPVGLDEMAAAQARNDYQDWQSRMLIEQEVGASDPVLGTPVGLDEMAAAQARIEGDIMRRLDRAESSEELAALFSSAFSHEGPVSVRDVEAARAKVLEEMDDFYVDPQRRPIAPGGHSVGARISDQDPEYNTAAQDYNRQLTNRAIAVELGLVQVGETEANPRRVQGPVEQFFQQASAVSGLPMHWIVPAASFTDAVAMSRYGGGPGGRLVTRGEARGLAIETGLLAADLLPTPGLVAIGKAGGIVVRSASRLQPVKRFGSGFLMSATPYESVPRLITPKLSEAGLDASLVLRRQLSETGHAEVSIGGRVYSISEDRFEQALRTKNPDAPALAYHADPDLTYQITGGEVPPQVRPRLHNNQPVLDDAGNPVFDIKPPNEQFEFMSPGGPVTKFSLSRAFGSKIRPSVWVRARQHPGVVAYDIPFDELAVPGSRSEPQGVNYFFGRELELGGPSREAELAYRQGAQMVLPATQGKVGIGPRLNELLYLPEALEAPGYWLRTRANLMGLADRLDPSFQPGIAVRSSTRDDLLLDVVRDGSPWASAEPLEAVSAARPPIAQLDDAGLQRLVDDPLAPFDLRQTASSLLDIRRSQRANTGNWWVEEAGDLGTRAARQLAVQLDDTGLQHLVNDPVTTAKVRQAASELLEMGRTDLASPLITPVDETLWDGISAARREMSMADDASLRRWANADSIPFDLRQAATELLDLRRVNRARTGDYWVDEAVDPAIREARAQVVLMDDASLRRLLDDPATPVNIRTAAADLLDVRRTTTLESPRARREMTSNGRDIRAPYARVAAAVLPEADVRLPQEELRTPDLLASEIRTPDLLASEIRTPDLLASDLRTPDLRTPDLRTPDLRTPDLLPPDLLPPEIRTPDLLAPEIRTPDLLAPEIRTPDLLPPEIRRPEVPALDDPAVDSRRPAVRILGGPGHDSTKRRRGKELPDLDAMPATVIQTEEGLYPRVVAHDEMIRVFHDLDTGEIVSEPLALPTEPVIVETDDTPPPVETRFVGHRRTTPRGSVVFTKPVGKRRTKASTKRHPYLRRGELRGR